MSNYLGINIDYSRDNLIPEQGLVMLTKKGFYKREWETSPQQSFARAATCYCFGDYELAQRIYDYVSKGWFTFASPVLSNAIDIEWPANLPFDLASDWLEENKSEEVDGMPISCFEAGTPILTLRGEVCIEALSIGDEVLTHKGRLRKVLATKSSQSSDIYTLRGAGNSTAMNVTGNHRMLTNKGWVRVDELVKGVHLLASNRVVDYPTADRIVLRPSSSTHVPYNSGTYARVPLPEEIELTSELAWALGFWFAEGSTTNEGMVRVTNQDASLITRWNSAMSVFGIVAKLDDPVGRNWLNGQICSKNLSEYFDGYFGKGCYDKTIPADMMHMNEELFASFFEGLYAGDGFKTTKHKAIELANTRLIAQVSLLLNKFGTSTRLQLRKSRVGTPGKFNGILSIPTVGDVSPASVRKGIEMADGLTYYTIKELVKLEGRSSTVYDIQVEEDESFSVAGVIAHNCFLNAVQDTKESLVETRTETNWLSMMGGGVGTYFGNRSPDEKSTGVMAHLGGYDADTVSYRQTSTRRGSLAAYLDIDHPEIMSFIDMRNPMGGSADSKNFNLNHGVNITDAFMYKMLRGEKFELVDPKHGATGRHLDAQEVWAKIMDNRFETGEPYLNFIDTVNRGTPEWIRNPLYHVSQSNLCTW